jgi:broad specificity phosphatase PhoE
MFSQYIGWTSISKFLLICYSAGTRNSELTNHGVQQATRLGQHLKSSGIRFTHIFASPLKRAAKTAALIRDAQVDEPSCAERQEAHSHVAEDRLAIEEVAELMEQDFGSYEGKSFSEANREKQSGKSRQQKTTPIDEAEFVAPESKDSMAIRADAFLDERFMPLLFKKEHALDQTVAIVSHGIFLSNLWRALLRRLPTKSINLDPEFSASQTFVDLQHLGSWSNTGYLELEICRAINAATNVVVTTESVMFPNSHPELNSLSPARDMITALPNGANPSISLVEVEPPTAPDGPSPAISTNASSSSIPFSPVSTLPETQVPNNYVSFPPAEQSIQNGISTKLPRTNLEGWTTTIKTVNGRAHLKGLKRTGGGVGSAKFEEGQKTMESFFKRRKVE